MDAQIKACSRDIFFYEFLIFSELPLVANTYITFTCLKSTIERLEKGVNYAQKLTIKTAERRQ